MSDDWRLRISLDEEDQARDLAERLAKLDLPHDLRTSFGERVVVSRDGAEVFCYADTRSQAEATNRVVDSLAQQHGWPAVAELRHWHPTAERWEDPEAPLPETPADQAAERAELMQAEREESRHQGFPDFEVRVRCGSRHEAEQLANRLASEGVPTVHRWEFVVLGADDEDSANALAERVRREAPAGSTVTPAASAAETIAEAPLGATPFNNPFAVFGGIGG